MRKRIYQIIEVSHESDKVSAAYDVFMMISIIVSVLPLAFKKPSGFFSVTDVITVTIFIVDYALRWITADIKLKRGALSFVIYPFTPWAIIDLLSILPSISVANSAFKLFRLFRMIRALRVLKLLKAMRYSKSLSIIIQVLSESKEALSAVMSLAIGYILISALVIFNVEPNTFDNFFDAVYWATVSLTTVGYGDIYPTSTAGRIITMISSLFGIAIVALPAGIITAGYMDMLKKKGNNGEQ